MISKLRAATLAVAMAASTVGGLAVTASPAAAAGCPAVLDGIFAPVNPPSFEITFSEANSLWAVSGASCIYAGRVIQAGPGGRVRLFDGLCVFRVSTPEGQLIHELSLAVLDTPGTATCPSTGVIRPI
jgi:hypothetical protein